MKKRHVFSLILTLSCVLMLGGCGGAHPEIVPEQDDLPAITVGCDDYTPFSYVDSNGELTGIDVELAEETFGRLGYKPEFTIINWDEKKTLLENGDIDCVWSSFTMNDREDEYRWAGPYMYSAQVVAVNEDSDIYSLSDLEDRLIAVQSTTKPEDILRSRPDGVPSFHRIISVQKRDLIFTMLAKGYVDAASAHVTAVEQFMKEFGVRFRILDEPLQSVGLGAAFSIDDDRGIDVRLGEVMEEMRTDGTSAEIIGKYLSNPEKYLEAANGE